MILYLHQGVFVNIMLTWSITRIGNARTISIQSNASQHNVGKNTLI